MQIIPLASESLGTRGFSIFIITEDKNILIDPSVSLGPIRNGFPPHLLEIAASYLSRRFIMHFWKHADILIQTHYHADHYSLGTNRPYEFTNHSIAEILYSNPKKVILAKSTQKNINYSQKKRASWLWSRKVVPIYEADGNTFVFGRTKITFSDALPHGKVGAKQGWVVSVYISDSFSGVIISSDIMGPGSDLAFDFLNNDKADMVIIDGPATYHPKQNEKETEKAFERILTLNRTNSVMIDHHFLRDVNWRQVLNNYGIIKEEITLASLLSMQPMCLESIRGDLYNKNPLNPLFHQKFHLNDIKVINQIKQIAIKLPLQAKLECLLRKIVVHQGSFNSELLNYSSEI